MSEEKMYTIECMETNGPVTEQYTVEDAVKKLNNELENNRSIFIDGVPVQVDLITDEVVSACKKSITIVNQLIGG